MCCMLVLPSPSIAPLTSESATFTHGGSLESWQSFSQAKYLQKYPWLVLKPDGIYCQYCSVHQPRGGANEFVTFLYTCNHSDKLLQHERSGARQTSLISQQETLLRSATNTTICDIVKEGALITADETDLSDAPHCMYFLMKMEIAHTTNFAELQSLCGLLGNTTLPLLQKARNLNYLSKQTMGEMVVAIGLALESDILRDI